MRILIVEDDHDQAETLTKLLKKVANDELVVYVASTLQEGLTKSLDLKADVTLLDLNLPDTKSWHEVVEAIPRFYPPVIVVTGMDDPNNEVMLEAYKYGAQNFFHKPFVMKLVTQILSSASAAYLRRVMPQKLLE